MLDMPLPDRDSSRAASDSSTGDAPAASQQASLVAPGDLQDPCRASWSTSPPGSFRAPFPVGATAPSTEKADGTEYGEIA